MQRRTLFTLIVLLHLFLVYISWGTTYLGFALTLEVMGPFFACGFRMGFGGILLCIYLLLRGRWQKTELNDWLHAAFFALFLVVAASGFLSYGQQFVHSGVASVITGSTPITMIVGGWLVLGEQRPSPVQCLGLCGGSLGLILLALEQAYDPGSKNALIGILWILFATFGWVVGSLLMRRYPRKKAFPPLQDCGLLLLIGGLESLLCGTFLGEWHAFHWERLTLGITIAFSWMVVGGAIIAYSSYFWLLRHVSISVAVSYEYVVPVIALCLGHILLDEPVTKTMIFSSCLAIGSVFLVVRHKHDR